MACQAGCSSWDLEKNIEGEGEGNSNISNSSPFPPSGGPLRLHRSTCSSSSSSSSSSCHQRIKRPYHPGRPSSDTQCERVSWQGLPDVVLLKVLGCLADMDRCNTSATCSRWRRIFTTPSLWRRRYFVFRGFDAVQKTDGYNAFLTMLGRHMRHVSIELSRPNINTANVIAKALKQFVSHLNKRPGIRLLSVQILNADFVSGWHFFSHNRAIVLRALCNLMKKQTWLRSVDLSFCLMDRDEGSRLLEAVSHGTRLHPKKYLARVDLRQFFYSGTPVVSFVRYGKVMGQFVALSSARLDLRSLNEAVLEKIVRAAASTLRRMELDVYADESVGRQAIGSQCWRAVRQLCPVLCVLLRIHGLCGFSKYVSVLVRDLPLNELRLTYLGVENLANDNLLASIRSLIVYLGDTFHNTLERLHIQVRPDMDISADVAVVNLVRRCPHLRDLGLNFFLQAGTVLQIIDLINRHTADLRPVSLKTRFHLSVRGMTPKFDRSIRLSTSRGQSDVYAKTLSV